MNNFFDNIWDAIGQLVWSDWMTIIILIAFLILGFKRGMAKELINFGFLLFSIVVAYFFYEALALSEAITWLLLSHQSHMAISFGVIFIGVLLIKKSLYKLTALSNNVGNPCALNKIFALVIFLSAAAVFSWYYLDAIAGLGIMEIVVTNESARIGLSFAITFALVTSICSFISNVLNISIDGSKPCFLSSFYKKILDGLNALDVKLNAKNINSTKNNVLGAIIGIIKGSLAILVMVLVFQSIDQISQQHYWIETNGALRTFQDIATDIKPELSQHLLFIKDE